MAPSKAELVDQVSDQQALVNALMPKKRTVKRFPIPGGRTESFKDIFKEEIRLYKMVRARIMTVQNFKSFKLMFADTPEDIKTELRVEFDSKLPVPWDDAEKGRSWLAKQIVDELKKGPVIGVEVTKEGIFTISPAKGKFSISDPNWNPYIEFQVGR